MANPDHNEPASREDRELDRQGRRMGSSGGRLVLVALVMAIPGVILILIDHGWSLGVGLAVLFIAAVPGAVGIGLLVASAVSRWSARRKLFA
jgi:hypothetical protein